MTDRNDGRPRHSASHIHCAVPFFCARSGTKGEAAWRCGEWVVRSAGNASRSLRACVGAAWGNGSTRGGRVAVRGRAEVFGGEWVVRSAGNASRSLRACVGAAWASGSAREGRVAVRGREEVFGGEWVVRLAGLTHIRRSSSRARVLLLYVRRATAVKSRPWGRKGAPANAHRPRRLPHPPRLRLYFRARVHTFPHTLRRRPRRLRPPAAAVIHNGLSTEKLSTSLLAALCKTFSPSRLRTRIYNISFARRPLPGVSAPLWERGRAVVATWPAPPCAGWGRAKAKTDAPLRSNPHFPCLRPRPCQLMA